MNSINSISALYFSGKLVSKVNVSLPKEEYKYRIYELDDGDKVFLMDMQNAVDLKKLYDVPIDKLRQWNALFECSTTMAPDFGYRNYIIANENACPCGALVFSKNSDHYKLRYVCTWPTKAGKREVLAGKSLLLWLYKKLLNEDNEFPIRVEAVKNGLFNPIKRYEDLGFSLLDGDDYNSNMEISKNRVAEILEKYDDIVHVEEVDSARRVDLGRELDISY